MKLFAPSRTPEKLLDLIEGLEDLLASAYPDLRSILLEGLIAILSATQKTVGVVLVKSIADQTPLLSIGHNVPESWQKLLDDPNSSLTNLIGQDLSEVRLHTTHLAEAGSLTIIPLTCHPPSLREGSFQSEQQGLLLLEGDVEDTFEQQYLTRASNALGRTLKLWHSQFNHSDLTEQLDKALSNILAGLSTNFELSKAQYDIALALRNIFNCQAVVLAMIDGSGEKSLVKKAISIDKEGWLYQVNLQPGLGILGGAIQDGKTVLWNAPTRGAVKMPPLYRPEIDDIPGYTLNALMCVPFGVKDQFSGAIELIRYDDKGFSEYEQNCLVKAVNTISSLLFNIQLTYHLRVQGAELESGAWELSRSRNTLRSLFDNMPSSVYIIDQEYRLIAANLARAQRSHIENPGQITGQLCYVALFQRNAPCSGCQVGDTLFLKKITHRKERLRDASDETQEWEINTYPITNDKGQPIQAIMVEQDITESRRLESILAQSEKLAAIGQLAAGIAHEINNPLTVVLANAQILQRDLPDNEDWLESLDLISRAATRALQVVRNLLGVSRKEEYALLPVDINENILRALELIQHEMAVRSVTLGFEPGKDLPLVLASADHLQGVWLNIVLNALDATGSHPGGKVQIQTYRHNDEIRVAISDNGLGITPDRMKRIFEPFYTTKDPGHSTGGTGLGLSVSHRIIKQHGGDISVESKVEEGTTFTVTLPIMKNPGIKT